MTLGFINDILRGVWFIDPSVQAQYAELAERHLVAISTRQSNESFQIQAVTVAIGMNTGKEYSQYEQEPDEPYFGIVPIQGAVMSMDYCGAIGTNTMQRMMQGFEKDPKCLGHVLKINSPGGSASSLSTFANFIKNDCKKPVVAHVSGMCASAAYYICCAADEIYCEQSDTFVGSIGVYMTLRDNRKQQENSGIKTLEVYSTLSTQKNDVTTKALDGDVKPLQKEIIDPCAEEFISTVKNMRPNLTDLNAYQGKLFAAKNAPTGMIDGITNFNGALAACAKRVQLASFQPFNS